MLADNDEVMTTESLMIHAIERGLFIKDFQELSVGMILDYINQYDLLHMNKDNWEKDIRKAGQNEFDYF